MRFGRIRLKPLGKLDFHVGSNPALVGNIEDIILLK